MAQGDPLQLTADTFSAATGLTLLQLVRANVSLDEGCFDPLRAGLVQLGLISCNLQWVLEALDSPGVTYSLEVLDLSHNNEMELEEEGYDMLLRMGRLRQLHLHKARPKDAQDILDEGGAIDHTFEWPCMWSQQTVAFLWSFSDDWRERHPEGTRPKVKIKAVCLDINWYDEELEEYGP